MEQIRRYKFTVLIALVITVLSTIPIPEVKPLESVPFFDKWVHFVMYGAMSVTMWLDANRFKLPFSLRMRRLGMWFYVAMIVIPSAFGGLMELVQAYLTTVRSGDFIDFLADAVGAVIGTVVCKLIQSIWLQRVSAQN